MLAEGCNIRYCCKNFFKKTIFCLKDSPGKIKTGESFRSDHVFPELKKHCFGGNELYKIYKIRGFFHEVLKSFV